MLANVNANQLAALREFYNAFVEVRDNGATDFELVSKADA
jgi:hypothetical protein